LKKTARQYSPMWTRYTWLKKMVNMIWSSDDNIDRHVRLTGCFTKSYWLTMSTDYRCGCVSRKGESWGSASI
jgi:hypothetical protein